MITFSPEELGPCAHGVDDDRARIAVDHADLDRGAATSRANEHCEALVLLSDADRVLHGVQHVIVADTVLAGTRRDDWHTQASYLATGSAASYLVTH